MRSLQIALLVFISLSLVSYNSDSLAAKGSRSSKSSSHKGKLGRKGKAKADVGDVWARIRQGIRIPRPSPASEGFGELPALTTKKSSGLSSSKTAKKTDALHIADEEMTRLTTIITPKKLPKGESRLSDNLYIKQSDINEKDGSENSADLNAEKRYTPLGRLRFAKKEPSTSATEALSKKLHIIPKDKAPLTKDDFVFKSPSVQRIRTRLGLNPELFKNSVGPNDEALAKNFPKDKKSGASSNPNNTPLSEVVRT